MSPEESEVLAANEAFYRALAARDTAAMDRLWACDFPVACVHPGWPALCGRDDVMASWHEILGSPAAPDITCHDATVRLGGDMAFVLCVERLEGGELTATNVFARQGRDWRLVHHHAGPIAQPGLDGDDDDDEGPPPGMLN